ncbi:MAG: alpha/beta fold hydrolase [Nocardioides sp.]
MDITSGSATLATESHGSGPDVLLIHAGVTDQRSWTHVVDALPDHRVISYDARGFGRTTYAPEEGWSPVGDAVAVLDGYDAVRPIVVGASMGGRTALDLALRHPDRVQALVLIGPAISGAPDEAVEELVKPLEEEYDAAYEAEDLAELNRLEAHLWLDGPLTPEGRVGGPARELFLEMNGLALASPEPGEARQVDPAWDRLADIGAPTLVLVGEHDLRHVRENAAHLAATMPDARLVELPGVAHLPHLEADPATLREIADFVGALR